MTTTAILRAVAGVVVAMIVAFVLVVALELFSAVVHPVPADFKETTEEIKEHVARCPQWFPALAVPVWGITALASTWIANRIGGRIAAIIVGLFLVASVVFNVSFLPYPIWFKVACVLAILVGVVLGIRHSAQNVTGETQTPAS